MSLPADDADSSSSRVGNGVIDVLVIPKPLARNHSFPEGGGYPVRGGGGMWRGDSNHIGSGGGFNCERDDRPGDDNSSNCAHWRSGNRRSLQPQLTSSVYSGGCLMVDGFRRRPDSDLARTSNQPEKPMERRNWCDNPERFLYPDYLGPNRMTTRAWSKRVPGVSSAFRCHPNRPPSNRQWCRRRRPPARLGSKVAERAARTVPGSRRCSLFGCSTRSSHPAGRRVRRIWPANRQVGRIRTQRSS